jgi:hypothetical protein
MLVGAGASAALLPLGSTLFAQSAPVYEEIDVPANAGRISGSIKYNGPAIDAQKILVTKDSSVCGEGLRDPETMRLAEDGSLGDVVVQIRGITRGKAWDPLFDEARIYQIDCSFQPYVQIIRDTADVFVTNFDPILHNIHAYEVYEGTRRSMFNFSQPNVMQEDRIPLSLRRGHLITIDCNAHNWMASWLYTSPNPYLGVTSVDGKFDLSGIPPGQYQLAIWHPLLGEKLIDLPVGADADLKLNLVWT